MNLWAIRRKSDGLYIKPIAGGWGKKHDLEFVEEPQKLYFREAHAKSAVKGFQRDRRNPTVEYEIVRFKAEIDGVEDDFMGN